MRILALQLKRIGDLILTTPALRALRNANPSAEIALAVKPECASLLGAIDSISSGIVLGRGRGFAPWQQVLTGPWDWCIDFTGSDRSALAVAASRASVRATFASVRRAKMRSLAYNSFADSPPRERHTVDHYFDLVRTLSPNADAASDPQIALSENARANAWETLHSSGIAGDFVLIHPGTARAEKYWLPERWAEVIDALKMPCVITGGPDAFERLHIEKIRAQTSSERLRIIYPSDLRALAAIIERAALVVSCDTAAMHFGAAFRRPQVALFGPTNPFHWRPRHERAVVLSAAKPDAPLLEFAPRMKGAPMDRISTDAVIRATDAFAFSTAG